MTKKTKKTKSTARPALRTLPVPFPTLQEIVDAAERLIRDGTVPRFGGRPLSRAAELVVMARAPIPRGKNRLFGFGSGLFEELTLYVIGRELPGLGWPDPVGNWTDPGFKLAMDVQRLLNCRDAELVSASNTYTYGSLCSYLEWYVFNTLRKSQQSDTGKGAAGPPARSRSSRTPARARTR